jgi:hypothetical protein
MTDTPSRAARSGDDRLLRACLFMERLCAERAPAAERLAQSIGAAGAQELLSSLGGLRAVPRPTDEPGPAPHMLAA